MARISACSRPCQLWRYHSLIVELLFGNLIVRSSESSVCTFVLLGRVVKQIVISFFTDRTLLVGQDYGSEDGRRHGHYRIQNF